MPGIYHRISPIAAALLLASQAALADSPFDQMVVFGDSLSDSGQFPDPGAPLINVGGQFAPAWSLRFTSRTDGTGSITDTVAVQRLAEQLGLGYLAPSTPILPTPVTSYPDGTNYAVGGYRTDQILASITDADGSVVANPGAGLYRARDGYLAEHGSANARALYYVNGGGNDVLQGFITDAASAQAAADNLSAGINALHQAGARYIMVSNLPDVGNTPLGNLTGQAAAMSGASALFNQSLYANLQASDANVIPVDARGLMAEVLADPAAFGYAASAPLTSACYEGGALPCNHPVYGIDGSNPDPDALLFNDAVHPTAATQQILAGYMFGLVRAPQEVGQLPVLGARLVDGDLLQSAEHQQTDLAARRQMAGQWQLYLRGHSSDSEVRNNYADSQTDTDGQLLGLQYGVSDQLALGLTLSAQDGELTFADTGSRYQASSLALNLYTSLREGAHWLNANLHYGQQDYDDLDRRIALGLVTRTETGSTEGQSLGLRLEYGYNISPHANWDYGPRLELSHRQVDVDGYRETAGLTTSLNYGDQQHTSNQLDLGLFVNWRALADRLVVSTEWGLRSELSGKDYALSMSGQSLALNDYRLPAYSQDQDQSWHANLTVSYYLSEGAALSASLRTDSGDNLAEQFSLGASFAF